MNNKNLHYDDLPDYLTVKELREYLRIGHNKAYQLASRPDFPSLRFGSKKLFPKGQVKEWAEREAKLKGRKLRAL